MEEDQKQMSFTFEIDNFSDKKDLITSPKFSSGGCEWYVGVYPKGKIIDDHLSLFLYVANPESLRLGWKRRAIYSFFLLNQSGKELIRKDSSCHLFCAQFTGTGFPKALPLKKLQEKGFLEKNKLRVKVEVKVVEVVDEGDDTGNETLDVGGFKVLYSQVLSVDRLFIEHPDFAVNVRPKNQLVKSTYMNLLLALIETLDKPPHSITDTELSNAQSELIELTGAAGFKLDWLKTKLDEISLARKKANADGSRVQEREEQIQNLKAELNMEKTKSVTSSDKVLSLEQTVSDLKDEVLDLKELEDHIKNLKAELNMEKTKSDTSSAKVLSLEQTVSDLKDELNKEKGKSDTYAAKVVSLEQTLSGKKANADGSRVQEFMEQIQNLKAELNKEKLESHTSSAKVLSLAQTVSDLKDELNKEKGKSDTYAAKVVSLEQTLSDLRAKQNKKRKLSRK